MLHDDQLAVRPEAEARAVTQGDTHSAPGVGFQMVVPINQIFEPGSRAVPACRGIEIRHVSCLRITGLLAEQRSRGEQKDQQCS